jgi:signal transduction histidine kinase
MASNEESERMPSTRLVEMVVRTLRHEVGDLLQSVYSAVAILQERLPRGQNLERTILGDLRGRAEICKNELDAAHDLVCPIDLQFGWVELSEIAASLVASFALRSSELQIHCDAPRPVKVWGDAQKLRQIGTLLILALCQTARSQVLTRVARRQPNGVTEWSFTHDGPAADAVQLRWLSEPFGTTREARFGLGLALARLVIERHGGSIEVGASSDGVFRIALFLPPSPPEGKKTE